MRPIGSLFLVPLLLVSAVPPTQAAQPDWQVCFTPEEDCTGLVLREIGGARSEILVQAYSFTSRPIARALIRAAQRGVRVAVLADRSLRRDPASRAWDLRRAGIPVTVDEAAGLAHNKVLVIDQAEVLTGSFNFTYGAQRSNAENLLLLKDAALAARYAANWRRRAAKATAF